MIKPKTSPARLAQLLQPSSAFCFSTVQCAVIGCKLKQNANEGCNSCTSLAGLVLSFIACFILLVIAPLSQLCGRRGVGRICDWLTRCWAAVSDAESSEHPTTAGPKMTDRSLWLIRQLGDCATLSTVHQIYSSQQQLISHPVNEYQTVSWALF